MSFSKIDFLSSKNHYRRLNDLFKRQTFIKENGGNLSGGQLQRIAIARALYNKPSILLLDEPTSALDNTNQENILHTLKKIKGSLTILMVSHNLKELKFCDEIIEI